MVAATDPVVAATGPWSPRLAPWSATGPVVPSTAARDYGAVKVDALYEGRFATLDPAHPIARRLAVSASRIVALDEETDGLEAPLRHDFGREATVVPGFHDAHCHTTGFGLRLGELDLSSPPVESLEHLYELVGSSAAGLPAGMFVVGSGYDQNKIGGRHPERRRLDEVAGGRPVLLKHTSGHMCVVSSAVFAMTGGAERRPIEGGLVRLDENGEPTGLLEERAQALVQALVLPRSLEELAGAIRLAHERYVTEGLTSVTDAGVAGGWIGESPLELAAYQLARERGWLGVRSIVMISADVLGPVNGHPDDGVELALDAGIRTGLGDEWLRIGPLKIFSDGSLIGRTCWMEDDFADEAGNSGYPQSDPDDLRRLLVAAHTAGWQLATHAIGDRAIRFVLDCYGEALAQVPRGDHRHRVEHCGVANDEQADRLAALGVIPVPQGRFVSEIGDGMLAALGPERSAIAYRMGGFRRKGIVVPGSSDRPVVDGRPLLGIRDLVVRRTAAGVPLGQEEAVTADEALRAWTVGSAYAARCEAERGTLSVGKLADFAVLEADPREVEAGDIGDIAVLATVVGGEVSFSA